MGRLSPLGVDLQADNDNLQEKLMTRTEREFEQIATFIKERRDGAIGFLNYATVSTYWAIGAYVSARIKAKTWGDKTVEALCDYLKTRMPRLKGFGRRNIYNMVSFHDVYSSAEFVDAYEHLKLGEFVQSVPAQIGGSEFVQALPAQIGTADWAADACPAFLALSTFSNHVEIINHCRRLDENIFYILYAAKEGLNFRELRRCLENDTFSSVMSKGKLSTKALHEKYPGAEFLLKDRALLDFLNLPSRHTEHELHAGIRENIRKFILELGKDFLWMGDEYSINVGGKRRRLDLLFYHRALRCLVDVELKAVPFEPEFIGKMDFYLAAIDAEVKRSDENPSVGLLLCPSANSYDVRYALDRTMSPMMVAEYKRLLIPKEVLCKSLAEYCAFMKGGATSKPKRG